MSELNEQEKYCLGLMIVYGGEINYYDLRDLILEFKEYFSGLNEKYLKKQKIKNVLKTLIEKGYIIQKNETYNIKTIMELGLIQESPIIIQKAIKNILEYRKKHVLEFNTDYIEKYLLTDKYYVDNAPYGLLENLEDALRLIKIGAFDSVLVKCGKCVEIMVNTIDAHYEIFEKKLFTGNMIRQLKQDKMYEKFEDEFEKDSWITFLDGIGLVYKFRNIIGAHESGEWREDQVAMSCLILTFYLVDSYLLEFNPENE